MPVPGMKEPAVRRALSVSKKLAAASFSDRFAPSAYSAFGSAGRRTT